MVFTSKKVMVSIPLEELGNSNKITPSEKELMSFKEQERQDDIKRELFEFRKKNSMLNDNQGMHQSIIDQKPTIFAENKSKKHSILDSKNVFGKKSNNILTGGGGLW